MTGFSVPKPPPPKPSILKAPGSKAPVSKASVSKAPVLTSTAPKPAAPNAAAGSAPLRAEPRVRPVSRKARLSPLRPMKLRLVDAVALAAGGLLLLKLLSFTSALMPSEEASTEFSRRVASGRNGYELPDPTTTGSVGAKEPEKSSAKAPEPPQAPMLEPVSPSERALLEKLSARRDALRQKTDELDMREKVLNEAERKLETGLGDLKQVEDKIDTAAKNRETAEKQGLRNIVTMYEAMKPKDAGRVFDRLGHDVLVPLVLAMNPRKMAEILSVMQPEAAERLTVALANRARGVTGPQAQAGAGLPPTELQAIDPGAAR